MTRVPLAAAGELTLCLLILSWLRAGAKGLILAKRAQGAPFPDSKLRLCNDLAIKIVWN